MRHRLPPELSGTAQTLTCLSSGVGALATTVPPPYPSATANCGRYATANNPFAVTHDLDFDLAYVAIETDIETLRDRLVYEFPFNKPLVEALVRRINDLHAKERTA